jgi:hypothetical protein
MNQSDGMNQKAPAELFDAAMVQDLVRAAELLEKEQGGKILDDASRDALTYARRIGLGVRFRETANTNADVRDSLITAALAALRSREHSTAVNLLGAYIDLKAEGAL